MLNQPTVCTGYWVGGGGGSLSLPPIPSGHSQGFLPQCWGTLPHRCLAGPQSSCLYTGFQTQSTQFFGFYSVPLSRLPSDQYIIYHSVDTFQLSTTLGLEGHLNTHQILYNLETLRKSIKSFGEECSDVHISLKAEVVCNTNTIYRMY